MRKCREKNTKRNKPRDLFVAKIVVYSECNVPSVRQCAGQIIQDILTLLRKIFVALFVEFFVAILTGQIIQDILTVSKDRRRPRPPGLNLEGKVSISLDLSVSVDSLRISLGFRFRF